MRWTVRERTTATIIHVNVDMDELTANGDLGHVVPGSCHAFLDLMRERADALATLDDSAPRLARAHQGRATAL
ncbi:MAG: hypothetical protein IT537_20605 [Hyphomicrobiales bacterium]|nr:hypothetical protein [Hyphomicrobiales bacterium]